MTTITIGSNSYNLVALPAAPGFVEVSFSMNDTVAEVLSPFSRQSPQVQAWPGADWWEAQATLPPMPRAQAAAWQAFLAEMRGKSNVVQLGDPLGVHPQGAPLGVPVVDGSNSANNMPGATTLYTKGWKTSTFRLLLPGDYIQIGYRLHVACEAVNSDANGNAQVQIWPSLREQPADSSPLVLNGPKGIFRLADNKRGWHSSVAQLTSLSFSLVEAR
ncbi:MAG TPA: hypothetical protein VKX41_15085 [Alloacidobacterium sp.]|jgi:hypothetical protein|nr:hypothetical protein [Alloacidobacterium sp.]